MKGDNDIMAEDKSRMRPIDFNNLDEAKQPSPKNSGFSAMDTVSPEKTEHTKTTGDQADIDPAKLGSVKADDYDPKVLAENPSLKDENKLPPAEELERKEEDPNMRKLAGEAPHVTARNPTAFTPEVEGGVVNEEGKNKKPPAPAPKTTSPAAGAGTGGGE